MHDVNVITQLLHNINILVYSMTQISPEKRGFIVIIVVIVSTSVSPRLHGFIYEGLLFNEGC